jgi:hypothetical protein
MVIGVDDVEVVAPDAVIVALMVTLRAVVVGQACTT